ncbi:MAG: leucine-rich repeat protein [Lachnospiraceae bacterium]|nr:leucine-rich repeat protein [Lachnospiraceae bacterium]
MINIGFVFDGTDKQLIDESVVSATGSAISVKYAASETNSRPESGAFTEGFPVMMEAGTYYVWYLVTNSSTSESVEGGPLTVSIGQATPQFATPPAGISGLKANGTSLFLITGGSAQTIGTYTPEVTYAVTSDNNRPLSGYSSETPSATGAGTYYVWYQIEGTRNWTAADSFEPITVVIAEPDPAQDPATPTNPAPVTVSPVDTSESAAKVSIEEPKPTVFTRKNKDGSVTTITIIMNADGTTTVITEITWPDGTVDRKEITRDAKGNGTLLKTKKDADGNILSKTEGTIKVNKKGTETIKSVTENSDGSKEETTQKTYKRDADNIKKVTTDTKKIDAEGNTEEIKMTALVDGLGAATITESSTFSPSGATDKGNVVKEERQYSLSVNGRLKLLSLISDGGKLTTPESIELDGMVRMLKAIGKNALKGNKALKETVIGQNVTTICAGAFKNCTSLELIELTSSVKKIYKNAFKGIAKNARFVIDASEEDFARIVELLKASDVSDTVTFERVQKKIV